MRDVLERPDSAASAPRVPFHLPALPDVDAFLADARAIVESGRLSERAVPDLSAFTGRIASAARSRALAARSFAIPIHAWLGDQEVDRIVAGIRTYVGEDQ